MPPLSLIICVSNERDLLTRCLREGRSCCDDLVVVHDGPDATDVRSVVESYGGRFYERPQQYQQEPHWPFAWNEAKHDWILRLDADEFPSPELREWLMSFRTAPEPGESVSGYTCEWPLWNGRRAVTKHWPDGRIFLFSKRRVRFFGMAEMVPVADARYEPLKRVLHHQPKRRSYGIGNIVFREQAYRWRSMIAQSLSGTPKDLTNWRWDSPDWPPLWESLRRRPLKYSLVNLFWFPLCQAKNMLRAGELPRPAACLNPGLHHFLLGLRVCREKRRARRGTA